jgi:hypothetical protein
MKEDPLASLLKGTVEVDETYIGGKPPKDGEKHKRGWGTKKAPVMAIVERGGKVITKPVENVTARTLKTAIREAVDRESRIITDEYDSYALNPSTDHLQKFCDVFGSKAILKQTSFEDSDYAKSYSPA